MTSARSSARSPRGFLTTGLASAGIALLLAGCGVSSAQTLSDDEVVDPVDAVKQNEQTEAPADPAEFSLAFAGDVHFARQIAKKALDPEGLAALKPYFEPADFAMVNLETAITESTTPMPGKRFTFGAPASALTTLSNAGIDAVSMANNHAADHGATGLADTLAAKDAGTLPMLGIGRDAEEAYAPLTVDLNGASVAVLAATGLAEETYENHRATDTAPGVAEYVDPERMLESVRAADDTHDAVIAYMHMGNEGYGCVRPSDMERVDALREAGADIIVLSHAHRLAGIDRSDDAFVAYGLGNFVWYTGGRGKPSSNTGVLSLDVTVDKPGADDPGVSVDDVDFTPMVIGADGIPVEPTSAEKAEAISEEVADVDVCGSSTPTN